MNIDFNTQWFNVICKDRQNHVNGKMNNKRQNEIIFLHNKTKINYKINSLYKICKFTKYNWYRQLIIINLNLENSMWQF